MPFGRAAGDVGVYVETTANIVSALADTGHGTQVQRSSAAQLSHDDESFDAVITDPPYYDNIGYADLSDFFYVWLRRSLQPVLPSLFATVAVPKAEELVATSYLHGGKDNAEKFFLDGMTSAMTRLAEQAHPGFPVTIYYAFKQSDSNGVDGTSSTGWDTFLGAVIRAGSHRPGAGDCETGPDHRSQERVPPGTGSAIDAIAV